MFLKLLTILVIFGISNGQDSRLSCTYMYGWMYSYFCLLDIDNPTGSDITAISGNHRQGRGNEHVVAVYGSEARPGTVVTLPSAVCQQFGNLTDLWMDGIGIKTVGSALSSCKNLENLYLGHNGISELTADTFNSNSKLKLLDLGHNKLETLPTGIFKELKALESLYLDGNELAQLDDGILSQLEVLKTLWLSYCGLSSLNPKWFENSKLEVLDVDHNDISDLPTGVFSKLNSLTILKISSNNLTTIYASSFAEKLENLLEIHASSNKIDFIDPAFFDQAKSLTVVDFTGNSCIDTKFDDFSKNRDENLRKLEKCFSNYNEKYPTTTPVSTTTTTGSADSILFSAILKLFPLLTIAFKVL